MFERLGNCVRVFSLDWEFYIDVYEDFFLIYLLFCFVILMGLDRDY